MKWSETIRFAEAPAGIALLENAPGENWAELLRAHEAAARQAGRQEAEAAGAERIGKLRRETAQLRDGTLASLAAALPNMINEAEEFLVRLALDAAERVVAQAPIDAALVEAVVRDALQQTRKEQNVTVLLHPEDLALLQRQGAPLLAEPRGAGSLTFCAAGEISRGGCVLQTGFGRIDARREVKWKQLREAVQ